MRLIVKILKWTLIGALICLALLYAGDYLSLQHRIGKQIPNDPFDTLQFRRLYAIPQKNGKDDFQFGDPETQACVHSLFPHDGYSPCWYAIRQEKKPIFY